MRTGKITRKIAMLLSLVMLITSTIGTTYCYIVTKTDPITNVFVPGTAGASGLTVSKTVEHPLGEDYAIPDNIRFDFNVALGPYYANAKLKTTAGEMTANENGTLRVTIRPGMTFGIEGLEEGTTVKVTEEATDLDGFAVKGDAAKTVTVGADGTASIQFVNTYTPDAVKPDNITVRGVKILEGRDWQTGDKFTFILEQKAGESWTKLGEQTVSYDTENADFSQFDFSDVFQTLTFDKVGTYTFRMSEAVGTLENVDYDKTVNHFSVKVTDVNMDGKLEINTVSGTENIAVTNENGTYAVSVTFNNTFVPPVVPDPDPITVQIDIEKKVHNVGELTHGLSGFEFVLKNTATKEKIAVKSDDRGKSAFALTFTKADIGKTYAYTLSETDQNVSGMTYDADVHEITVSISLTESNELAAALTLDGRSVKDLVAVFENTYDAQDPDSPATGDSANLTFWFVMMIVSAASLIFLATYEQRHRNR